MSSTTCPKRDAREDAYWTPPWCVEVLLPHLERWLPPKRHGTRWRALEPAAGIGHVTKALRLTGDFAVDQVEIDDLSVSTLAAIDGSGEPEGAIPSERLWHADFFEWANSEAQAVGSWDLTITNPPFALAFEFAERLVRGAAEDPGFGTVVLLLRLAFLSSLKRRAFLKEFPPDVGPFDRRPSFMAHKNTDSADYAWMVWPAEHSNPKFKRQRGEVFFP